MIDWVSVRRNASVTCTVKVYVPGEPATVPLMRPVVLRVSPVGMVPDVTAQVNGGTPRPFCTVSCRLSASPMVLLWLPTATTTGAEYGAALMRNVRSAA